MTTRWLVRLAVVLGGCAGWCQDHGTGPVLSDLMQILQYADMLRAAKFSREQVSDLAALQARWLEAQRIPDEMDGALQDVALQVAGGRSIDSALVSVGVGEEFRQSQERSERTTQALAAELRDSLKPDQRQALLVFISPERGLAGLVEALRQMRKAPPQAWEQVRQNLVEALSGFGGPRGTAAVAPATIVEWLEGVRKMPDAEFEKAAPDLPGQWARALAPEMMRQVDDPRGQDQRLLDVCRRLLSDPGGRDLVPELVREAKPAGTPAPAPEAQAPKPAAP